MKTIKKITSFVLALLMTVGTSVFGTTSVVSASEYPELVITEVGVDQYGDSANANNKNKTYNGAYADRDPFEFMEIVNNSDKSVNVFDYMLAYQGAKSDNAEYYEKSVYKYTPFYPGEDWTDGPYTSYDTYWANTSVERPANPEYKDGAIASGEVFVAWIYNGDSHALHATLEEFRSFWKIPAGVKVFVIDGFDTVNKMNFSLKNQTTGSYMIMHSSERFLERRSSDSTYDVETRYKGKTYEELDEVISWAIVDYTTDPIKTAVTTSKESSNFTVSYLPYADGAKAENGFTANSFASNKRVHIEKINTYDEATVGTLNAAQTAALAKTKTSVVKAKANPPVIINEQKDRPSLIITEISADNRTDVSQNINPEKGGVNSDPYECLEVYNNSDGVINIYDYMVGYQGSGATNVSTYFERLVQEYTPIFPGADWIDGPYTAYDSLWAGSGKTLPANPAYEEGVLQPGEVAVIWAYSSDSHKVHAQVEHFRAFWSIPSNVKVFILDANSSRDKNFNIKNSDTGTYIIMKPCDKYPVRRGDDETFSTELGPRLGVYYDLHAGRSYDTESEIVSWAVVCFNLYEPLYTFRAQNGAGSATNNYTLVFAPYNGEKVYTNGFLTMSIPSQKRMHLQEANTKAHIGVLTDAQKVAIKKAQDAAN